MVDAHTNDARNNMELLRNVYGSQIHIFDNYIPFSIRMKEAVREGQSIFSYDPKSKATEAYRRVTEEVLEDAIYKKKEQLPFPYSRLMHCLEQTKSQSMELVR